MHMINVLPAYGEEPIDQVSIDTARTMKKCGQAYFVNRGQALRLQPTFEQEIDRRQEKGLLSEWQTVHASRLSPEQRKTIGGARFLKVTTFQYQPNDADSTPKPA